MTKTYKLIVALSVIIIVLLIIFFSKDYIIRKYFIYHLEKVDYDEYILELSVNNKKSSIQYYTSEFVMERTYDNNGELSDCIITREHLSNIEYSHNLTTNKIEAISIDSKYTKPLNINNYFLLSYLKNEYINTKFRYKGTDFINNRKCYILEFEDTNKTITTIYLDVKLFYTIKIDTYISNINHTKFAQDIINRHVIYEYTLHLDLKQKYLFETK